MASAQICPVVGTTTTVLPPNHPSYDESDSSLRCPVTNATTSHHKNTIHNHPSVSTSSSDVPDATECPAMKSATKESKIMEATCPIVGSVSAVLPPDHPNPQDAEKGAVCPVTKATLEHHQGNVHLHPRVQADAGMCPVAGKNAA